LSSPLVVWLGDRPVADLVVRRGNLELAYRPELVAELGVGGLCLSAALPVQRKPFRGDRARNWCEGLLPEGEMRTMLERQFRVRRGDTFALLAAIGRDCAGAVSFLVDGEQPEATSRPTELSAGEVVTALNDLPEHPLGADKEVRVSLGGLQAKLLLTRTTGGWCRPVGGTPSTHIVKPDSATGQLQGLVVGEALVLRAAGLAGVPAACVGLDDWGGWRVLIVERYDRRVTDRGITRVHQEDGCQALGMDPTADKYQTISERSPSYARLAAVLRDHAVDVDAQWARLGETMTVSVAVGNVDAHARNHSFLLHDGVVELAPLYDVAPTVLFARSRQLGLWVGGQARLSSVTRGHLVAEMCSWGALRSVARDVVERTLNGLESALPAAADGLGTVPDALLDQTVSMVRRLGKSSDN
jgi:serine/threonine-protein kinase HipA